MSATEEQLDKLVIIGNRVLIKPISQHEQTRSGLFLPPGVLEKEKVQSGYVIRTGPGYPIPVPVDAEPWEEQEDEVRYIPLQVLEGDLAIYLQSSAIRVMYAEEKYVIVPQESILMVERDEGLFD